jgi:hypothetical protein
MVINYDMPNKHVEEATITPDDGNGEKVIDGASDDCSKMHLVEKMIQTWKQMQNGQQVQGLYFICRTILHQIQHVITNTLANKD